MGRKETGTVLRCDAAAEDSNDENSLVTRWVGGFRTENAALYLSRVTFKGTSASIYGSEIVVPEKSLTP